MASPATDGLRWESGTVGEKPSVYAGLRTVPGGTVHREMALFKQDKFSFTGILLLQSKSLKCAIFSEQCQVAQFKNPGFMRV